MSESERAKVLQSIQLERKAIMEIGQMKSMAVDAMVKYVNDDEIYNLAKALEEAAERVESVEEGLAERGEYVHA